MADTQIVAEGLYFGEGPRWHAGRLWFSDFYDHAVKSMGTSGDVRTEHTFDDQPSGLGWLPDGALLVVAMQRLQVLRETPTGFVVHADLTDLARFMCNDMTVDNQGRAWVGNFGFDLDTAIRSQGMERVLADVPTTNLVRVDPDGSAHCAAADMAFPNGTVITPDGDTLIIAETLGARLTAFDITADGTLANRRVWAALEGIAPDGIALDAEGNVWVANALAPECVLVSEGGRAVRRVQTTQNCYACMLGGEDGRQLFARTAKGADKQVATRERAGRGEVIAVESPGAGWP